MKFSPLAALPLALTVTLSSLGCGSDGPATPRASGPMSYMVTIENLTTGQPFSPGVLVSHTPDVTLWMPGAASSPGIIAIAENGDPATAVAALNMTEGVREVVMVDAPNFQQGGGGPSSLTYTITADPDTDVLSLAVMMICTNDGFTGFPSRALPEEGEVVTFMTNGMDAGSEMNDELFTSIVDACGAIGPVSVAGDGSNDAVAADGGVIALHPAITGMADLDATSHAFTQGSVARITIEHM